MGYDNWRLIHSFKFESNAVDVVGYILQSHNCTDRRTIKYTDPVNPTANSTNYCNLTLSGIQDDTALYTILFEMEFYANSGIVKFMYRDMINWDNTDIWRDENNIWIVKKKYIGEIRFTQNQPNYSLGEVFIEPDPKRWNRYGLDHYAFELGTGFITRLWSEIINGWLSRKNNDDQEDKTIGDKPWKLIPEHYWDRLAVELYCDPRNLRLDYIASRIGVSPERVNNRISELRGQYPEANIPYRRKVVIKSDNA